MHHLHNTMRKLLALSMAGAALFLPGCGSDDGSSSQSDRQTRILSPDKPPATRPDARPSTRTASAAARPALSHRDYNLTAPAVLISGRITFWDGRPVTSASLQLHGMAGDIPTQSQQLLDQTTPDKDGRYEVYGLDGPSQSLKVSGDFAATSIQFRSKATERTAIGRPRKVQRDIVIPKAFDVRGRVVNENNEPIPGVPVMMSPFIPDGIDPFIRETRSLDPLETTATATGEFTFSTIAGGRWNVGTTAPGYAPVTRDFQIPESGDLILQLSHRGGTIQGHVRLKSDSTPVEGTSLSLHTNRVNRFAKLESPSVFSDTSGRFRFDNISSGSFTLRALKSGATGVELGMYSAHPILQVAESTTTDVEVLMYPGYSMSGLVYDKDTSDPLAGVTVSLTDDLKNHTIQSDAAGRYRLHRLFKVPKGQISITASLDGYALDSLRIDPFGKTEQTFKVPDDFTVPIVQDLPMIGLVSISGKVVTRDETPIPNAKIMFLDMTNYYRYRTMPATQINPDGTFKVFARPFKNGIIFCNAVGYGPAQSDNIDLLNEDIDNIKIVMDQGATVRGIVLSPDGQPVPEANISNTALMKIGSQAMNYGDNSAVANSEGQFILSDAPLDLKVTASKKGFAASEVQELKLNPGEIRTGVEIRLQQGTSISGRVMKTDKTPLDKISLNAYGKGSGYGSSAADGTFTIPDLVEGVYSVYAYDTASRKQKTVQSIKTGTTDLEIVFEDTSPLILIGTVVDDKTGQPVSGLSFDDPNIKPLKEPGKFQWANLQDNSIQLFHIEAPGYDRQEFQILTSSKTGTFEQTFKLGKAGAITGRIIDKDGKPVPNISVVNWGTGNQTFSQYQSPKSHTTSNAEGRFVLAPAPIGTNSIVVKPPAPSIEISKSATVQSEETADLGDIALSLGGTVYGRVTQGTSQTPVPDKNVQLSGYQNGNSYNKSRKTDAEGRFEFTMVPPYNNMTLACGSIQKTVRITGEEKHEANLQIGGVAMAGTITRGGQPVSASLSGKGLDGQSISHYSQNGEYKLTDVLPGKYDFEVEGHREMVTVPDQPEFKKDFQLPDGRIIITVLDSAGKPVPDAVVGARLKDSPTGVERSWEIRNKTEKTKADGTAELSGLTPGLYAVTAQKNDLGSAINPAVTIANAPQNITLRLSGGGGTLVSVALRASDGQPHPNAWVYLHGPNGLFTHGAVRDSQGVMTIRNIPPGIYKTNVSYWSFSQSEKEIEIKAGETTTLEDVLYAAGSIQWTIKKADGSPAAGATVVVTPILTDPEDYARNGKTDNNGNFEDRGMAQGTYQVTAQLPGKSPVSEVFEVRAGSHTQKDLTASQW